jgi:hypothetical protein
MVLELTFLAKIVYALVRNDKITILFEMVLIPFLDLDREHNGLLRCYNLVELVNF